MKFSDKVLQCGQSPMRKFHPYAVAAEAAGKTIYHLNIGQPDIHTPAGYFETVRNFHEEVLAYAASPGEPRLISAIRRYYRGLGADFSEGDILITTGGSEALQIVMNCLLNPGDEVIVPEPFYSNYSTFVRMAGGVIHPLPTYPEEGYYYADTRRFEACLTPRSRALLITNPGNPTGVTLSRSEMRSLLRFAQEHDLYLIADEVYREFVYTDEPLATFGQFEFGQENLILIDSVSKRFSACGARVGCLISRNQELMSHALKCCQARLAVATLDQAAASALYEVEPAYFQSVRDEYRRRRDTLVKKLAQIPGVIFDCPKGAFYLMAALPIDDAGKFQKWLLESFSDRNETVMFAEGASFYATPGRGKNEIRIAYVLCPEDLSRAAELLGMGIEEYNRQK